MSVKLQLGYVATGIRRTYITHVAETLGTVYVGMRHRADGAPLGDDIQGQRVHEVLAVGSLKHAQHYPALAMTVVAGRPAHTGDDMRLAQVKTRPGIAALIRGEIGVEPAVESLVTAVHRRRLPAGIVVHRLARTYYTTLQFLVGSSCLHRRQKQEENHYHAYFVLHTFFHHSLKVIAKVLTILQRHKHFI